MKGAGVDGEIGAAEKAIRKYKLRDVEVLVLGEGVVPGERGHSGVPGHGRLNCPPARAIGSRCVLGSHRHGLRVWALRGAESRVPLRARRGGYPSLAFHVKHRATA